MRLVTKTYPFIHKTYTLCVLTPTAIVVAIENFLPLHCEPPQATKQSPYWPEDCFPHAALGTCAALAMTGDG